MGRTERWGLVVGSIGLVLALSVPSGGATPVASDGTAAAPSSTLSGSPAEFAERITSLHEQHVDGRIGGSLQDTIEAIVLTALCAIGVASYASASAGRDRTRVPVRIQRR